METFQYDFFPQKILFSPGALARLAEEVEASGWRRVLLCTSPSQRAAGIVERVSHLLGARLCAVFDTVLPHVQDTQVDPVLALANRAAVDAVIGLGGGSAIGMAKAAAALRMDQHAEAAAPLSLAVIAIPTTYAGSEMTAVYGVTHSRADSPHKETRRDPRIIPRLVLYDPLLTLNLPPAVTGSTGMNALAHCLEALYAVNRNPLSSAAAVQGVNLLVQALPRGAADGGDLTARNNMLLGAHLAGLALAHVSMGLHHGLCHVLGGSAGVPHGAANSILLPHVLRFNPPVIAEALLPAAQAAGVDAAARSPTSVVEALARRIEDLARQIALPQRLRDAGVAETDLPRLAEIAFQSRTVHSDPRPIPSADPLLALLRAAW